MFKRIDHIEITAKDFEKNIEFYSGIFGFKLLQRQKINNPPLKEIAYMGLGDTVIELLSFENPTENRNSGEAIGYRMMALEVLDMEKAIDFLKSKGIMVTWGPVNMGMTSRAEVKDLDGNSIELREWKKRPW